MPDWKKINSYFNSYEADIAQSVLDSQGIESRIMNAYSAQILFGAIQFELWVEEENSAKALEILNNPEGGETPTQN